LAHRSFPLVNCDTTFKDPGQYCNMVLKIWTGIAKYGL
jgi:hypothetical protein